METSQILERLASLEAKVDILLERTDQHLEHHFKYNIMVWGAIISAVVGIVIALH
jgi:hypothetical protein